MRLLRQQLEALEARAREPAVKPRAGGATGGGGGGATRAGRAAAAAPAAAEEGWGEACVVS